MSYKFLSIAWEASLPPITKLVFVSLADQSSDEGVCWPSINTIATRTGLCERSVREHIRTLESLGYLETDMRSGRSTVYKLIHSPGTTCPPIPRQEVPPPRQEVPPTPAPHAPTPAPHAPIIINNQQENHQRTKGGVKKAEGQNLTHEQNRNQAKSLKDFLRTLQPPEWVLTTEEVQ